MPAAKDITEEMLFASVRELGKLLRARQVTSQTLTETYLDRLEKIGPKLGAVVTITRELALKEAQAADREIADGKYRGPLHGIPYGLKDLAATKGIPTTWGAEPYKNQVFDYDATIVKKLRAAGAVLVAKLAMVELAGGFGYGTADASFTGPGRTPWNSDYWSGGSSSGPGAATAAGLVGFSIGSETSGSIITPTTFCGLSGLRPTYGRVSRTPAMALCWTLDKLGPMCRTADDCGLVLAAIAGRDAKDPTTLSKSFTYDERGSKQSEPKRFRVGIVERATESCQPEVHRNFEDAVAVLKQFCDLDEEVEFPDLPYGDAINLIIKAEAASAFRDLIESGKTKDLRAAKDRWGGQASSMVLAVDYLQAMRIRGRIQRELDALYADYDALIAPSLPTVSYPIGVDFDKAYPEFNGSVPLIQAGNLAGQPALAVCNGFGPNNLPTGIQFTGRVGSEARLLAIAEAYQRETAWHKKRPVVK